jgi:hypothetical protein
VEARLAALGYRAAGGGWRSAAGQYPITIEIARGALPDRMRRDRGVNWYLGRLAGFGRQAAGLQVCLVLVDEGAVPAALLGQRSPLDLVGITELAERGMPEPVTLPDPAEPAGSRARQNRKAARAAGVAELLGWSGPPAGPVPWSLLAELDSRTNAIEALTKFAASGPGFRLSESMAPRRFGVAGLLAGLARRTVRWPDLAYAGRAMLRANRERRVPPRVYLSQGGDTILDYAGMPGQPGGGLRGLARRGLQSVSSAGTRR